MDPQPSAPPVVAVVVTCNPGFWLEDTLRALAAQDYPNLSVLVIDAASTHDPTPRVASVLPGAYVRRLSRPVGFSQAANEVLSIVEGASHYLFCHDDVAPEAATVGVLVEEAFRSNAGIVSPKLVDWDHPDRLLAVGQSVDKTGVPADLVERGELDQEQHDSVRDVFCAPGGCMLVRADLFASLGGFDPAIDLLGEDLNLSWRCQVVGARVVVAPAARVRHLEVLRRGEREDWDDPGAGQRAAALEEVHRVRTLLTCYSVFHLVRVVPQGLLLSLGQAVVEVLTGRPRAAAGSLLAWPRALRRPGRLMAARRSVQRQRTVSDSELRTMQTAGSARVRAFVRDAFDADNRMARGGARRTFSSRMEAKDWRLPAAAWVVTVIVVVVGSRGLLSHGLPSVGSIPITGGGPAAWWRLWWSGWRPDGLGSTAPAPTALGLLGLAGTVALGGVGLLQKLLVLGPLIIGPLGAYRAARPLGSPVGRAAALITYAAVPLPYNALAGGRWAGLVVYAAAPWLLSSLCRLGGDPPFVAPSNRRVRIVSLGLLVALTAAFVPAIIVIVPVMGIGLAFGSILVRRPGPGQRALVAAVLASAVAVVLLLPASADTMASPTSLFGVGLGDATRLGLGDVLRFHTGNAGGSAMAWGLLVAAALPLLIGRSWRLSWASRLWGVAICSWLATWTASRGWLPIPMATPEAFLAPAAAALALSVGLGAVAFRADLPGYRLGWRQVALVLAAAGVTVATLPALGAMTNGRWHLPERDFASSLSFMADRPPKGAFRVLWVGDPRALPLGSWQLSEGVGYATSNDGAPGVADLWPPHSAGATPLLAADLRLAAQRMTSGLGHLLAPLAVRYIVVPGQTAPAGSGGTAVPVPAAILAGLGGQTDLRSVPVDDAVTVYENAAWVPGRALLSPEAAVASQSSSPAATLSAPLAGSTAAFPGKGPDHYADVLPPASHVLLSASDRGGWQLSVAGHHATRQRAFGWAMVFATPDTGGKASLHFATPIVRYLFLGLQVGLWLFVLRIVLADRRRQRGARAEADSALDAAELLDESEPIPVARGGARWRPRRVPVPAAVDGDEAWS